MTETTESDDFLYHYTTQEGLIGILETNCLWATHYKFLNDYTELTFAKEDLKKVMSNELGNNSNLFDKVYGWIEEYEIYITSFCKSPEDEYIKENGLLSQWRGYGSDGGVAILFDKAKISHLITKENKLDCNIDDNHGKKSRFLDDDVIYSHDSYSDRIKSHRDNILKQLECPDEIGLLIPSYLRCIGFYKSQGFKEENEYRILASLGRQNSKVKNRKFRGLNKDIPYIELFDKNKLDKCGNPDRAENKPLPIKKIIIGPHKDKETRAARLRVQLGILNKDVPVTISKTPFVGR